MEGAAASAISSLITSLVSGIGTIVGDSMSAIGQIVPAILPIVGAGVIVRLAFKYLKKVG